MSVLRWVCVRAKDSTEMDLKETVKAKCLGRCSAPANGWMTGGSGFDF
jgi:hypothetical protein